MFSRSTRSSVYSAMLENDTMSPTTITISANPVPGLDRGRHGPLYPLPVEPGPVRAAVGQPGLIAIVIQPQLQVRPGDHGVLDQQPVPLVDARAFAADDDPVVDRR